MLRSFVSLNSPDCMSIKDHHILDSITFENTWPDIIARKTIAGDFNYSDDVKLFLCDVLNLSWEAVKAIIHGLRRQEYYDPLCTLVSPIFDGADVSCWEEFLEPAFIHKVEDQIIFSEQNDSAKKIAKKAYRLVARMINNDGYGSLNHPLLFNMSQAKTVVTYILVTNIILYARMMECEIGSIAA